MATPLPILYPASDNNSTASLSPLPAASITASQVCSTGSSSNPFSNDGFPSAIAFFAFSITTSKEDSVSKQPLLPQLHNLLFRKRGMWLNSPATPLCPLNNSPFTTIPKPTPQLAF